MQYRSNGLLVILSNTITAWVRRFLQPSVTFPSTRDDIASDATSGLSFGVSSLINVFGGQFGGGFE